MAQWEKMHEKAIQVCVVRRCGVLPQTGTVLDPLSIEHALQPLTNKLRQRHRSRTWRTRAP